MMSIWDIYPTTVTEPHWCALLRINNPWYSYPADTGGTIPTYLEIRSGRKPPSNIETWTDWPADIVADLRALNHASCSRLRFPYTKGFTCTRCEADCAPNRYGDACLDGAYYCDDCLIDKARAGRL